MVRDEHKFGRIARQVAGFGIKVHDTAVRGGLETNNLPRSSNGCERGCDKATGFHPAASDGGLDKGRAEDASAYCCKIVG